MKKLFRIALLLAAFLPLACVEKPDVPDPNENEEPAPVEPVTLQLSFVLPDNGAKTAWAAGDQIVVHGEYAAQQVVVTLAAGDISGKKATVEVSGLYPYVREDVGSNLYAEWPASAVDNLKHCFFYSKFNTTASPILAACNDAENTFRFQEILGSLSFSTGDQVFDSFTIKANKKEGLGYEFMQVKITDKEQNFRQYLGTPILELDVPSGKAKNFIYIPAGTDIAGGIMIKFRKGDEFVYAYKSTEPISIERGKTVDLGDISDELKVYVNPFDKDVKDLDTEGNANCYVVTAPGKYKFKAVKGNDPNAYVEDPEDAIVLWETWNDDAEVEAGSVVKEASYAEDYMVITMPATLHPGNAVVALRDADGTIRWSWHIWVPETAITTSDYGNILNSPMMDRNLGALVAAKAGEPAPIYSFGLTYQWGRKDPFPGPKAVKSGDNATVAGKELETMPGSGAADESKITLEQSIANPTLLGFSQNGDWIIPVTDNLWSDTEKTIYDPCPPGYRVPARDKNSPFHASDLTTQTGWSESVENVQFTLGDPVAVFPLAGYRDDYSPGGMTHAYDRAVYWTAYASSESKTGYYVNVRSPGSKHALGEAGKSRAGSVRCVVE